MGMNTSEKVNDLYVNKDTLSARVNLHDKYSVNKYGWFNWVFDQYGLMENIKILEFGCGTGNIWVERKKQLPKNMQMILTDISPLMIEKTKKNLGESKNITYQVMDIQNTPFEENTFDVIIANHMLYHVPNIPMALSEVKRILKDNGIFYTTTIGENSLKELQDIYRSYQDRVKFQYTNECIFTLENGKEILEKYFSQVGQKVYIDSLEVTDVNDLMDYVVSYNKIPEDIYHEIYGKIYKEISKNGVFKIRKEQGMFINKI